MEDVQWNFTVSNSMAPRKKCENLKIQDFEGEILTGNSYHKWLGQPKLPQHIQDIRNISVRDTEVPLYILNSVNI
jgi:hypothetical protein